MTGSSVFDYIHHQDHAEMAEQLGLSLAQGGVASPSSQASDDGASSTATNNPDGIYQILITIIFNRRPIEGVWI